MGATAALLSENFDMQRTGTLDIQLGITHLDATLLARRNAAPNQLAGATNFVQNSGFGSGDAATVEGADGKDGDVAVMFITSIAGPETALGADDEDIGITAGRIDAVVKETDAEILVVPATAPTRRGKQKLAAAKISRKPSKTNAARRSKKAAPGGATKARPGRKASRQTPAPRSPKRSGVKKTTIKRTVSKSSAKRREKPSPQPERRRKR